VSNGRPFRKLHTQIENLFEQIEDQPLEGGCRVCNSFHTIERVEDGYHVMHVWHDWWCPVLRAYEASNP
jgi:hypothetical protein